MNRHKYGKLTREWVRDSLREAESAPLLTEGEIVNLLRWGAGYFHVQTCPSRSGYCEGCEESMRLWWDLCNSLTGIMRIFLQRSLREDGIPLPPHPGDDIDVVPSSFI